MNQIQFITSVQKLDIFKLRRVGNYFVEVEIVGTDFFFERTFKSNWKQKRLTHGRDVYVNVSLSTVLAGCDEETREVLNKNLHLFAKPTYGR
jgi:hypothetical protein